jgi:hypothetical protein
MATDAGTNTDENGFNLGLGFLIWLATDAVVAADSHAPSTGENDGLCLPTLPPPNEIISLVGESTISSLPLPPLECKKASNEDASDDEDPSESECLCDTPPGTAGGEGDETGKASPGLERTSAGVGALGSCGEVEEER